MRLNSISLPVSAQSDLFGYENYFVFSFASQTFLLRCSSPMAPICSSSTVYAALLTEWRAAVRLRCLKSSPHAIESLKAVTTDENSTPQKQESARYACSRRIKRYYTRDRSTNTAARRLLVCALHFSPKRCKCGVHFSVVIVDLLSFE